MRLISCCLSLCLVYCSVQLSESFGTSLDNVVSQRSGSFYARPSLLTLDASTGTTSRIQQHKDIVIVGGGLAGLSAALHCKQIDPSRQVTIFDAEPLNADKSQRTVASFAAAGMLAPQSERLPKGHLLDLCLESRRLYPDFVDLVEGLASQSGTEGELYQDNDDSWSVGYMACGGFLAPALAGDAVATWAPPEGANAQWLDETQVRELEPQLSPKVVGGWWFPEDASVDARRLTQSLRAACVAAGVDLKHGVKVESLDLQDGTCRGLWLDDSKYVHVKQLLLANGAWMRQLLPVPIDSHKGQSLSLRMPPNQPPLLKRVLFGQDSYICPKPDGRIVIGATVEAGSFDSNVTPAGILHILGNALELIPGLAHLPMEETWVGLRPTTPDKGPILGSTPWNNLFIGGGYWRNGVLLAPKTGELLAQLLTDQEISEADQELLQAFRWDRFTKDSNLAINNARYAASFYPVHSRAVTSASVGTELGFYASASSSQDERQADWDFLDGNQDDESLEAAARLGQQDGGSYSLGGPVTKPLEDSSDTFDALTVGVTESKSDESAADTMPKENADSELHAVTSSSPTDIQATYDQILKNKAASGLALEREPETELVEDPGFRIYYHDPDTDERIEVPPYTNPGAFTKELREKREMEDGKVTPKSNGIAAPINGVSGGDDDMEEYSETTFDGYQDIQKANSRASRSEELAAMREARQKNRLGAEEGEVDESKIGAIRSDD